MDINASIVLYDNDRDLLEQAINSFLNTKLEVKLFLVDNSKTDRLKDLSKIDNRIEYIFNNKNIGFGSAHNIAIKESISSNIPYHLVLNPDVYFDNGVIESLFKYMNENPNVANVMPKVFYPNGKIQYLCKLLPTPVELIARRFIPFPKILERINKRFELHDSGYKDLMNIPNLSGCFMFLRTKCLIDVGLFDENFFMFMEDVDLNRRLHKKYLTMFYPYAKITHVHAKESYIRKKMLLAHVKSSIYYFNKWGWFFDTDRRKMNRDILNKIQKLSKIENDN